MNVLIVKNLNMSYGKVWALNNISIEFSPGIYGLLGHNGAGKSTLIRILASILPYTKGEVLYNGKEIRKAGREYRSVLGYMPQQQMMDNQYTVESFLYYMAGLKEIQNPQEKIQQLLSTLNLLRQRKKRLGSLSGGMRQRVLIAQALLNDPDILLLDEPTAGLDPVERRNFRKIIADAAPGKIVILATHMMSDIEFIASRILIMKSGKLLINATQKELLEKTKVYISDRPAEELIREDPAIQLVNTSVIDGRTQTRYISRQEHEYRVPSTMDDVYLDWLG